MNNPLSAIPQLIDAKAIERQIETLANFVAHTHVLAWVYPDSDGRANVEVSFSRESEIPRFRHARAAVVSLWSQHRRGTAAWIFVRWWLMLFALIPVPIRFKLDGANHCYSYYFLVTPPPGLAVRRFYWRNLRRRATGSVHASTYAGHDSSWSVLSCYHPEFTANGGASSIDVGVYGPGLRLVWALVAIILVMLALVRDRILESAEISDLISVAAVLPSAVLGLLSERSDELTKFMTRWLQRVIMALVAISILAALAASVDFFDRPPSLLHGFDSVDLLDASLAYGAGVLTLLTYIAFVYPFVGGRSAETPASISSFRHVKNLRSRERILASLVAVVSVIVLVGLLLGLRATR